MYQAHTHTIWTHLKNPCMTCLSGLSWSLDKNGVENWANWTVTDTTTFWASSDPVQNRGSIFQPTVLPRQRFFLDSGRDEDSRIDADQCTGHVDDVQSAPGAFLRSSSCKAGSSNLVAVLRWNIKSDQSERMCCGQDTQLEMHLGISIDNASLDSLWSHRTFNDYCISANHKI